MLSGRVTLSLAAADDVGAARRRARTFVTQHWPAAACLADAAEVIVGELGANSLLHGGSPAGVEFVAQGHTLRLAFTDASAELPVLHPDASDADEHHRGLLLATAFAEEHGGRLDVKADADGLGKTVVCILSALDQAAARSS
ncbi:ATP-binding protein [Streptomyces chrestomyceticus]|uniref:ATP-binding protein n=1 Tax=Streptomyces chrestomyceticus TaxID=68185 RepID=UPI0034045724